MHRCAYRLRVGSLGPGSGCSSGRRLPKASGSLGSVTLRHMVHDPLAWSLPPELAWLLPTEGADGVAKGREGEHSSASELLADWRSAERDSVAAHEAALVAARAVTSAAAAEEAAVEAESAAREARDAAVRAKEAADRAKTLATQASEAAQLAAVRTEDEQSQADQTVVAADDAESEARDRFHSAQKNGFPKDRP